MIVTWDKSRLPYIYINGKRDNSPFGTYTTVANQVINSSTKFIIGKAGKDTTANSGWKGKIDEVGLYNRVLSEYEI
ncbi:MAG: hypothetical protein H6767_08450 [Candidatus Peribacteria bacterium]|nr:MAG: hypothetical protein H6767_08450 [Candidatus Peribacteria bacterium]